MADTAPDDPLDEVKMSCTVPDAESEVLDNVAVAGPLVLTPSVTGPVKPDAKVTATLV